jgi:hypothetical protein
MERNSKKVKLMRGFRFSGQTGRAVEEEHDNDEG